MRSVPLASRLRIGVVLGGALAIAGCFLVACFVSWMFLEGGVAELLGEGRLFLVLPLAPLTAIAVAVAGTKWTRAMRPSTTEAVAALLIVELIIFVVTAIATGDAFMDTTVFFWLTVSLVFAPWWLLGLRLGRRTISQRR